MKNFPASKLCWVTVDSNSTHNVVVWDTAGFHSDGITGLNLYYYNNSSIWVKLDSNMPLTPEYFEDTLNSNSPMNGKTIEYRLTGINACGNETPFPKSPWQSPIHIIKGVGSDDSAFTWNTYPGSPYMDSGYSNPVQTYILYRDTNGNGHFAEINSEAGNNTGITDIAGYSNWIMRYPDTRWYVGAILLPGIGDCPADSIAFLHAPDRVLNGASNITRSNITNQKNTGTGMESIPMQVSSVRVYPNPFTGYFTLSLQKESNVTVYDMMGRIVFQSMMTAGSDHIAINAPSGVYFLLVNGVAVKLIEQ